MLYLYDKAIVDDLNESFNRDITSEPVVKVVDSEHVLELAAQIQEDKIKFPIVSIVREPWKIDTNRSNFTRIHAGQLTVLDPKTNLLYYERCLPISVSYELTVLATNSADRDELIKEILFKYIDMYFLTIRLPYEHDRNMRFGVTIDFDSNVENSSGQSEYLENGSLYKGVLHLKTDGCVLLHYKPVKMHRYADEIEIKENL